MNIYSLPAWSLVALSLFYGELAIAQNASSSSAFSAPLAIQTHGAGNQAAIYIEDFQPVDQQDNSSGLLLSRFRSARNAQKVDSNASALSDDIVKSLVAQGIKAYRISSQGPLPTSGWLVGGVFSERMSQGLLSSLAFLGSSASKTPNTEVTVSIADLASDPNRPFAVIGDADQLKGQGTAAAWNPYMVAVHLVVNEAQASSSMKDLANKIAAEIVSQRANLITHDPAMQATPTQSMP
jgi:hypothetical protein